MFRFYPLRNIETGGDDWSTGQNLVPGTSSAQEPESPLQSMDDFFASGESQAAPADASNPTESNESPNEQPTEDGQSKADANVEEIVIKGEDGRKVKLKVDYANKENIKQAHVKAHNAEKGMRKYQAERDKALTELNQLKADQPKAQHFDKLDETFQRQGIEGVVDLLSGQHGAFQRMLQERLDRESLRVSKPDEANRLDQLEAKAKADREAAWAKKQQDDLMKGYEDKLARANEKEAYALLSPSFERYSVTGKLGDSAAEESINSAIWDQSVAQLDKISQEVGEENVTQAIVDRTFRTIASRFHRASQTAGKQAAKAAVTQAKQNAAQQVQAKAAQGMQEHSQEDWKRQMWNAKDDSSFLAQILKSRKF